MDSSFVYYDGRSVHDMIQALLAMSGDPEAIQRILDAIDAVDAKFTPVNAELARLETDKQDAGNYVENGGGDFSWLPFERGAYIARFNRGTETEGIRIYGQYKKDSNGYNLDGLLFNNSSKQILHQRYNSDTSTWSTVATYSADEDTGWLTVTNDYVDIYYRKKNSIVFIKVAQAAKQNISQIIDPLTTLPEGFRPESIFYTYIASPVNNGQLIRLQFNQNGNVILNPLGQTIASGNQIQGMLSFPV